MDPERYQQVMSVFLSALDLDRSEQAGFIERACAGDADLKREVESLLEHDRQSQGFLERPVMDAAARKAGSRIGPYEILEPIGFGGMGDVYRARDARFDREIALKILPAEFARDPDRVARFEREARAAGPLSHPNILTVYDCGQDAGVPYLVSELLRGETLGERLHHGAVKPDTAVVIAAQVARGLAAAHARAIVHRDLKPENLFIDRYGVVKILDFGLASLPLPAEAREPQSGRLTQAGMVMGSFGYMSPEQVRGESADHRSDIFSLGVVLFEMLAAKRPFAGDSWAEEANAILHQDPPELSAGLAGVANPAALQRLVRRCLAKQPEDRFQSASDLAFALDSVLEQDAPVTVRPGARLVQWAAAALVLLAAGAAIWWAFGMRAPAATTFQRLTFRRGIVSAARFTPDGHSIVYSAAWDLDDFRLFSTRTDSPESQRLDAPPAMLFSVSADGRVALCKPTARTQHGLVGTLATVPLSGGGAKDEVEGVSAADWSPDGSLAVVREVAGGPQIEYPVGKVKYRPAAPGGYIEALRVSPSGSEVAFLDHPLQDDSAGWVAMVDRAGRYTVLSGRYNSMRGLAWSADGKEVWFAAAQHGTSLAVMAVDRSRKERVVQNFPGYVSLEDVSRDGRVLIGFHTLSESLVHVLASGVQQDLYWHDQSQVQDISRGGGMILFAESGDATREDYDAYLRKADGSSPAIRLGPGLPQSLSPDGRFVIANPSGAPAPLTLLQTVGGPRTLAADRIHHLGAAWLPSGDGFVFAGTAPGEGVRYFVQSLGSGEPRPLTEAGVEYQRRSPVVVSPDGASTAAVGADGLVRIYPTTPGTPRGVPGLAAGYTPLRWCPDGQLVLHQYDVPAPQLMRVDIKTGKLSPWQTINVPNPVGLLDLTPIRVSPDCRTYAFSPLNVLSQVSQATGLR
jgi:hypothetical protein